MTIVVMISCDGCGDTEQEPVSIEDGVNAVEVHLEGWDTSDGEDLCPNCRS